MIVASHLVVHGIMKTGGSEAYEAWKQGTLFNRVFSAFFTAGGDVGVGIFFIISGYFLSTSSKVRRLNKLFKKILYFAALTIIVSLMGNTLIGDITVSEVFSTILPVSNNTWWFISVYVLLIIMSPAINELLNDINDRQLLYLVIVLWMLWQIIAKAIDATYYELVRGISFYMLIS